MSSQHYNVNPDGRVPLKVTSSGPASVEPTTVAKVLQKAVESHPDRKALCVKRDGEWKSWTYKEYYEDCVVAAKSLIKLGVEEGRTVCILGFNSPEWFISDIAAIMVGGFAAGIYTTNGPDACHYVIDHAKAQVVVVENDAQLQKILSIKDSLPEVKAIVQYTGTVSDAGKKAGVLDWQEFMRLGADVPEYDVKQRCDKQEPNQCCTLIYTSGTTGTPKAVMISHDNLTFTSSVATNLLGMNPKEENHIVSYLPLSHIAAQMVDIHTPIAVAGTVWFAQPDALKGSLVATLKEARPTLFLGVPRVWEKIMEKMQLVGAQTTGFKKTIATWAKGVGTAGGQALEKNESMPWGWWLANTLVFSKIKANLGLDRCRHMATAAAPIAREVLEYFRSLNINIYEVYGMSECTGPETANVPGHSKLGTAGTVIPGCEIKIAEPDADGNGEICFRGRHVFMGYLYNEAKTKEAIDEDGWLHSGDVGKLDADGFLSITGRIKELLITAGGENVAPVPIEEAMKEAMHLLSNVMVIGDKRKFLSMIVSIKCIVDEEANPTDELTDDAKEILAKIGSSAKTVSDCKDCPKVQEYITEGMATGNKKAVSRAQNVKKFVILPKDFSVPGGELGPTLKLRRPIVYKIYDELIEGIYA